jgi:acetyl-CoA carboxylase biotin carboxyl carrier protein
MDLKEIQNLIKFVANSGVAEVKLEMDDIKSPLEQLRRKFRNHMFSKCSNSFQQALAPQPVAPVQRQLQLKRIQIHNYKSPIIGTFIENHLQTNLCLLGRTIGKGDVLCVIEAMKLFNEIESEVSGKIVKYWLTICHQ